MEHKTTKLNEAKSKKSKQHKMHVKITHHNTPIINKNTIKYTQLDPTQ